MGLYFKIFATLLLAHILYAANAVAECPNGGCGKSGGGGAQPQQPNDASFVSGTPDSALLDTTQPISWDGASKSDQTPPSRQALQDKFGRPEDGELHQFWSQQQSVKTDGILQKGDEFSTTAKVVKCQVQGNENLNLCVKDEAKDRFVILRINADGKGVVSVNKTDAAGNPSEATALVGALLQSQLETMYREMQGAEKLDGMSPSNYYLAISTIQGGPQEEAKQDPEKPAAPIVEEDKPRESQKTPAAAPPLNTGASIYSAPKETVSYQPHDKNFGSRSRGPGLGLVNSRTPAKRSNPTH